MTDPISFTSETPRFSLPNLFVAQAQKEFVINEAFARLDGLLHPSVAGETDNPPAAPEEGESWIVGSQPTGDWIDQSGAIACWQADNWLFATPVQGMLIYDASAGALAAYNNGWRRAAVVPAPNGGATEDAEARAAITLLIAALVGAGILPAS